MKIGISNCSNGRPENQREIIEKLCSYLNELGIETIQVKHMYSPKGSMASGTGRVRAEELMELYHNPDIKWIFDVSGGDLGNEIIPYLDYDYIAGTDKVLWGRSDLSTVINSLYTLAGKSSVLWQPKHMFRDYPELQQARFLDYLLHNGNSLFDLNYEFLQGSHMEGLAIGGNMRCFLKLAGTRYWPDMRGKVVVLEALESTEALVRTDFSHLEELGVFDQVAGVLLGTYTVFEQSDTKYTVFDILKEHINSDLPVAQTREIGHFLDSKAIKIGEYVSF